MKALLRICGGLVIWAVTFSLMYGAHGLGCARGWVGISVAGTSLHLLVLSALWITGLALLIGYGVTIRSRRLTDSGPVLIDHLSLGLTVVSFFSLLVTGGPVIVYPVCL